MGKEKQMKSAIAELFYGNFAQIGNIKLNQKQLKSLDAVIENDDKLRELLKDDAEALTLYEKFKRAIDENAGEEAVAFYRAGFRNGFRLALDVMEED